MMNNLQLQLENIKDVYQIVKKTKAMALKISNKQRQDYLLYSIPYILMGLGLFIDSKSIIYFQLLILALLTVYQFYRNKTNKSYFIRLIFFIIIIFIIDFFIKGKDGYILK